MPEQVKRAQMRVVAERMLLPGAARAMVARKPA
jgi:hypothetical protein